MKRFEDRFFYKVLFYSNLLTVWKKFKPDPKKDDSKNYPTGVLWIIGVWSAIYGVVFQLHETSKSKIENKAAIVSSLGSINRVGFVQHMRQYSEPSWLFPFSSCFFLQTNEDVIEEMKALVEKSKTKLDDVDLSGAILNNMNLSNAKMHNINLENSDLSNTNLSWAMLASSKFKNTKVENTDFTGTDLRGVKFPWKQANLKKIQSASFSDDTIFNVTLDSLNLTKTQFVNMVFVDCKFDKIDLSSSKLENCLFVNSVIKNTSFRSASFGNLKFQNTVLVAIDCTDASNVPSEMKSIGCMNHAEP